MRFTSTIVLFLTAIAVAQQPTNTNYDETKVGQYKLPDPLVTQSGKPVKSASMWNDDRRPQLIRLYESQIFGVSPGKPEEFSWGVTERDANALKGTALRKQVALYVTPKGASGKKVSLLLYTPTARKGRVPVILSLNFYGNHKVSNDPGVRLPVVWDREKKVLAQAGPESRVVGKEWDVEKVLSKGFGFATIYYGDADPDGAEGFKYGIRNAFLHDGQTKPLDTEWGSIAAWGWALSRAMDYLESDDNVDSKRVAIMGHSRLGKAVLWAGARDQRFAMVWANCSGEGGASLSRRNYGETVDNLIDRFPWWFSTNFQHYKDRVSELPVDSHELIALIAPRPVYLATAEEDRWADPHGEFLAAVAASPVYKLLGKPGIEATEMPPLNTPIQKGMIGFHYRTGKHEVTAYDWDQALAFAEMRLKR